MYGQQSCYSDVPEQSAGTRVEVFMSSRAAVFVFRGRAPEQGPGYGG